MVNLRPVAKIAAGEPTLRLAVLIDADNAQAAVIEGLLGEIARFGEATLKRIYGDFTSPNSEPWKKVLNRHAIKPVQQFAYTTGNNATDSTLIKEAMDLLYTRRFDGFSLVSSASDFTGLALRIREGGLTVPGFGKKTPEAFRNTCHKFVFTKVLRPVSNVVKAESPTVAPGEDAKAARAVTQAKNGTRAEEQAFPTAFALEALDKASDDTGRAHLGTFGSYLTKNQPDFDSRLYGFKKLGDFVKGTSINSF